MLLMFYNRIFSLHNVQKTPMYAISLISLPLGDKNWAAMAQNQTITQNSLNKPEHKIW